MRGVRGEKSGLWVVCRESGFPESWICESRLGMGGVGGQAVIHKRFKSGAVVFVGGLCKGGSFL